MFLNNFKKVINELPDCFYILYISDEKECKGISAGASPSPNHEIIAHGSTNTMDNDLAKILLPKPEFIHNRLNEKMCNTYKCWACEDLGTSQIISHIEAINSWECLMSTIGNPKYVIITKELKPT